MSPASDAVTIPCILYNPDSAAQTSFSIQLIIHFLFRTYLLFVSKCFKSLRTISAATCSAYINANSIWKKNGITVAGGNGPGNGMNQLNIPHGLFVGNDQTLYIADALNNRIVERKIGERSSEIIADGNGQLKYPTDVVVDKARNSVFICDHGNKRVVRSSLRNSNSMETIISGVICLGLTMDEQGFLYVSDYERNEVRRWQVGNTQGIVVAGGNGAGNRPDQLNGARKVFVDRDQSVYVVDH
ncbi:unnamed protein product, partial [Rotaria magnacalcarata]